MNNIKYKRLWIWVACIAFTAAAQAWTLDLAKKLDQCIENIAHINSALKNGIHNKVVPSKTPFSSEQHSLEQSVKEKWSQFQKEVALLSLTEKNDLLALLEWMKWFSEENGEQQFSEWIVLGKQVKEILERYRIQDTRVLEAILSESLEIKKLKSTLKAKEAKFKINQKIDLLSTLIPNPQDTSFAQDVASSSSDENNPSQSPETAQTKQEVTTPSTSITSSQRDVVSSSEDSNTPHSPETLIMLGKQVEGILKKHHIRNTQVLDTILSESLEVEEILKKYRIQNNHVLDAILSASVEIKRLTSSPKNKEEELNQKIDLLSTLIPNSQDTSVAQDLALPVSKENNTSQSPATAQTKQTIFSSQDVASSSLNKSNAQETQEAEEINQAVSTSSTPSASSQRDGEPSLSTLIPNS
ncbi:hypothetical protein, partial [Holospora curviuscula]|uniref:hypothetical protein n=1 Tax=Holospora curviuscula TaxID=1082868 RepID=UPI00101AE460